MTRVSRRNVKRLTLCVINLCHGTTAGKRDSPEPASTAVRGLAGSLVCAGHRPCRADAPGQMWQRFVLTAAGE